MIPSLYLNLFVLAVLRLVFSYLVYFRRVLYFIHIQEPNSSVSTQNRTERHDTNPDIEFPNLLIPKIHVVGLQGLASIGVGQIHKELGLGM